MKEIFEPSRFARHTGHVTFRAFGNPPRRRLCALLRWLGPFAGIGCDSLGRPIVDEVELLRRPDCRSTEVLPCRYELPNPEPIFAPALDPFAAGNCARPAEPARVDPGTGLATTELDCAFVELRIPSAPSASPMMVRALRARHSELRIVAEQPATIAMTAALLESVKIELQGPVALQLTEASTLGQVLVVGGDAASLLLRDARASELALDLTGSVSVTRSKLMHSRLLARQVGVDTSSFEQLSIRAEDLFTAELLGEHLILEVGSARIAASIVRGFSLQSCDSMVVVSSSIAGGLFRPCTQHPLRVVDDSTIFESELLGAIESTSTTWSRNAFGAGTETSLEVWRSERPLNSFSANVFCKNVQHVAMLQMHSAFCNRCDALGLQAESTVCGIEAGLPPQPLGNISQSGAYNPLCPVLDTPPLCDPAPVDRTAL